MKRDMGELKKIVLGLIDKGDHHENMEQTKALLVKDFSKDLNLMEQKIIDRMEITRPGEADDVEDMEEYEHPEVIEESLSLTDKEREMIKKALEKHRGKRKNAANELGISERTLYRKIKEYNIK
jgi:transcriptional regulator with PAS, ATPase and Fis domain